MVELKIVQLMAVASTSVVKFEAVMHILTVAIQFTARIVIGVELRQVVLLVAARLFKASTEFLKLVAIRPTILAEVAYVGSTVGQVVVVAFDFPGQLVVPFAISLSFTSFSLHLIPFCAFSFHSLKCTS